MTAFIYTAVLFFGFAFGELKFRYNKLPESRSAVFENNMFGKTLTNNGMKIFEKFTIESDIEMTNMKNSSEKEILQGKSKSTNQIVIPLLLGVNITGVFLLGLIVVKFFLLKGIFAGKIALIVLGVILGKKIEALSLFKNHHFYFQNNFGQYPINEPDLSGYGYEYKFVTGFQTPEEKYPLLTG